MTPMDEALRQQGLRMGREMADDAAAILYGKDLSADGADRWYETLTASLREQVGKFSAAGFTREAVTAWVEAVRTSMAARLREIRISLAAEPGKQ